MYDNWYIANFAYFTNLVSFISQLLSSLYCSTMSQYFRNKNDLKHKLREFIRFQNDPELRIDIVKLVNQMTENQKLNLLDEQISLYPKVGNPLQPSKEQVEVLKLFRQWFKFDEMKLEQWLNLVNKLSFCKLSSKKDEFDDADHVEMKDSDYRNRAETICRVWLGYNDKSKESKALLLMDGHGRMIRYLIMELLRKKRQANMEMCVIDLDPYVTEWHKLFFPKYLVRTLPEGNVFNYVNDVKYLPYLNFCGITSCIGELASIRQSFFLSYSTARSAAYLKDENSVIKKFLKENDKECHDVKFSNRRESFVTEFVLLKSDEYLCDNLRDIVSGSSIKMMKSKLQVRKVVESVGDLPIPRYGKRKNVSTDSVGQPVLKKNKMM